MFDPAARALVAHREAIDVAWFVTGGALASDAVGRAEDEAGTPYVDDAWTAPAEAGEVQIWLVVRDDRGGVGWQTFRLEVR